MVAFADDAYDEIKPLEYEDTQSEDITRRINIIDILREYGKGEDSETLDSFIENETDKLLVKLAKLVQSANRIKSVVSDNLLVHIKKEIISNLSIDSEKKTDLEEKKGTYYGIEDATKEFKPSFFEAPDDSEHPQDWNVFKEVCAFLNSELGGTLYLGDKVVTTAKGHFSYSEAQSAGLFDKDTYKKYARVMIANRAFTYGAREIADDVIMGACETSELKIIADVPLDGTEFVEAEVIN